MDQLSSPSSQEEINLKTISSCFSGLIPLSIKCSTDKDPNFVTVLKERALINKCKFLLVWLNRTKSTSMGPIIFLTPLSRLNMEKGTDPGITSAAQNLDSGRLSPIDILCAHLKSTWISTVGSVMSPLEITSGLRLPAKISNTEA